MRHTEAKKFDSCADCFQPKPLSTAEICRACYKKELKGKPFGFASKTTLTTRTLTPQQREVFDAILRGHRWTAESRDEALGMIERAEAKNALQAELAFWTTGPDQEPPHKTTSLGLMSIYAPGAIQ